MGATSDKITIQKLMNEMRKKLSYIESTNWMFETKDGQKPEHLLAHF